jgi:hypothetical protein
MLYSIDDMAIPITRIPHAKEYRAWRDRLSVQQLQAVKDEINRRFDMGDVETAGWIPGSDWTGTVWQPIYDVACQGSSGAAGLCFGLLVWETVMEREDHWSFGRFEKDGVPIRSLTYFRIEKSVQPS